MSAIKWTQGDVEALAKLWDAAMVVSGKCINRIQAVYGEHGDLVAVGQELTDLMALQSDTSWLASQMGAALYDLGYATPVKPLGGWKGDE